jgi:5-methylcytosine-specific restriction enzyme subunit McrC
MEQLTLKEYQTAREVRLTSEHRDELARVVPSMSITPAIGAEGCYDLTPASEVGVIALRDLAIVIRPKLSIERVLFLISYAMAPKQFRHTGFDLTQHDDIVDAIIPGFVFQLRKALRQGLLQGYRIEEDCLNTVRGRIRFADQIRDRFGICPPVEVRYDEFTVDVLENRLLKAALARLRMLRIRSETVRKALRDFDSVLAEVQFVHFDSRNLPDVTDTRLNEHYRPAIELAKLILRNTSFDLGHGRVRAAAFLVDMNKVFEDFVVVAMRECLGQTRRTFPQNAAGKHLYLDKARRIRLKPDISWWRGSTCMFVGDVKYKRIEAPGIKYADLYQLLAYCVATGLPAGMLIYAAGEAAPVTHQVTMLDKNLEVTTLDLSASQDDILKQIEQLCRRAKSLQAQNDIALQEMSND